MDVFIHYPSHTLGGAELLLARVAVALSRRPGYRVVVSDYADGVLARQLAGTAATCQPFEPGRPLVISPDARVLLPLSSLEHAFNQLAYLGEARLLFWGMHPFNALAFVPATRLLVKRSKAAIARVLAAVFPRERRRARLLLELLDAHAALYFMDDETRQTTCALFGARLPAPRYLPTPIPLAAGGGAPRSAHDGLDICWVGRLVDEKANALRRLVADADAYAGARRVPVRYHVVGDGESRETLAREFAAYRHVEVRFLGTLAPEALEAYLGSEIDVVFAMGTSALEAARLGLPTALVDSSRVPLPPTYGYQWIFEARGYSLGRIVTGEAPSRAGHAMAAMLDALASPGGQTELADACYAYFASHHALELVVDRLVTALDQTTLVLPGGALAAAYRPTLAQVIWAALKARLPGGGA